MSKMSNNILLQAVIECYIDGILLVSDRGEIISDNRIARQICQKLNANNGHHIPAKIWRVCRSMIENRALHADYSIMIDDEIEIDASKRVRIRVQWFNLDAVSGPCLLIMLEDRFQSAQKKAIAERERYGLTNREAEVWLLRQANCTYKAIAEKLHITVDTVKKHMRNIHAKREAFQWAEE